MLLQGVVLLPERLLPGQPCSGKLNEKMEVSRISIRQIRDEIKSAIEKAEKEKEITEDDKYDFIDELDGEVKKINDKIKEIRDNKEKDIMTI